MDFMAGLASLIVIGSFVIVLGIFLVIGSKSGCGRQLPGGILVKRGNAAFFSNCRLNFIKYYFEFAGKYIDKEMSLFLINNFPDKASL